MYVSEKLLLTVQETAFTLNCSAATVYKLIHDGKLGFKKHGKAFLVSTEDVVNYSKSVLLYDRPDKPEKTK